MGHNLCFISTTLERILLSEEWKSTLSVDLDKILRCHKHGNISQQKHLVGWVGPDWKDFQVRSLFSIVCGSLRCEVIQDTSLTHWNQSFHNINAHLNLWHSKIYERQAFINTTHLWTSFWKISTTSLLSHLTSTKFDMHPSLTHYEKMLIIWVIMLYFFPLQSDTPKPCICTVIWVTLSTKGGTINLYLQCCVIIVKPKIIIRWMGVRLSRPWIKFYVKSGAK